MKRTMLVLLVIFVIFLFTVINYSSFSVNANSNSPLNEIALYDDSLETNYKRTYNYEYYTNSNNNKVNNINDIKKSIYNGLNNSKDIITMYCDYDNCLNDFYTIYRNKSLMTSINNYVHPFNQYKSTQYKININNGITRIEIVINKKYTEKQIEEINKILDSYINKLDINRMSSKEKIKWAHDFIINRDKYDLNSLEDSYSAYGAIVGKKAVCQGYADAMALILDRFDIPNVMISNSNHIWNIVYVNGSWLHIDATWDDPILSNGKQERRYDYYLITSDKLSSLDDTMNHNYNSNYYQELLAK